MSADRMRVALVCNFPGDEKLGSSRVPLRLGAELGRMGVDVSLLFADDLPFSPSGRVDVVTAPFRVAAALAQRASDADVVEISGYDAWLYARVARRLRPRQVVVSRSNGLCSMSLANFEPSGTRSVAHGLASDFYQRAFPLRYERASIVEADLAIFASDGDAQEVVRRGWRHPSEAIAVHHGVDEFFASEVALDVRRDVAFVGTFFHRKGSDIVARSMSNVLRARPTLGLTLFGPGVPAPDVLAAFDEDVRSRVTIVDALPAKELARRLATFAIFVFPTRYEAFGLVVPEAMRAGLAVVTTPTGAGADLVRDGENGLLVPIGSAEATEAALLRLVDDPGLRTRLGARAAADAAELTWAHSARRLEAAYRQALERVASVRGRA